MNSTNDIKLIIADDHKMFREGIRSILEKEKTIQVIDEAGTGSEVVEKLQHQKADVVLMDIDMPGMNGIEATRQITDHYPEVKILALSMHFDHNYIIRMLEAGAKGYILKNTGKDEMITAIKTIAGGDSYFSNAVSQVLIEQISKGSSSRHEKTEIPLTRREQEVLQLIAMEYSNHEIAEKLFISIRTVDTHRRNLLEKLNVKNTAGLVKYAMKNNLL